MGSKQQQCEKSNAKFSVFICVYNKDMPDHFHQALSSIVEQTLRPNDIILVVDGPVSPPIEQVIKIYENEPYFKIVRLSTNVGHGIARRIGLENCSNDLVALMDADDISIPTRFEKQIACLTQDDKISIVGGQIKEFVDSVDNIVGVRRVPLDDIEIKQYLKRRCPFNQVTVMFRKSAVEDAGGYLDWHYEEDYYLWIRMYERHLVFKNLDDTLVLVRVGHEMYQRRGGWMYFKSETALQRYMLSKGIIKPGMFFENVSVRFILQVLMPSRVRGYIFRKFARKGTQYRCNGI